MVIYQQAIFWAFIFYGGSIIPGVILCRRNHQGDNLLGDNLVEANFSRGQFSGRQSSRIFFFFGGGAILYRETNPEGSLLRGNLLEAGQIFSGCDSLFTLFLLI